MLPAEALRLLLKRSTFSNLRYNVKSIPVLHGGFLHIKKVFELISSFYFPGAKENNEFDFTINNAKSCRFKRTSRREGKC